VLDVSRILDHAPDWSLGGVEIQLLDIGVGLTDVPRAESVARALAGHGSRVSLPLA